MVGQAVKELLYEEVTYNEPYLTHAIYYAVQKGIVTLEESASNSTYEQLDYEAILKMRDDMRYKAFYHSHGLQTIRSLSGGERG